MVIAEVLQVYAGSKHPHDAQNALGLRSRHLKGDLIFGIVPHLEGERPPQARGCASDSPDGRAVRSRPATQIGRHL